MTNRHAEVKQWDGLTLEVIAKALEVQIIDVLTFCAIKDFPWRLIQNIGWKENDFGGIDTSLKLGYRVGIIGREEILFKRTATNPHDEIFILKRKIHETQYPY